ncbi:hypothetical protein BV898_03130 [Hypsibius exemplaris]|uniref:G-protein coupled receptors family 1 profile domain-containing protein n=1 Tax=Hypsibius exemplaris TaxID=2072580 RepID=A0A1W0X6Q7_HYPEX|nr:hypothetical protein BV898_03130 [Hypsibius exemplaris]
MQGALIGYLVTALTLAFFGAVLNVLLLAALTVHQPLRETSGRALLIHCILMDFYITTIGVPIVSITLFLGPTHILPRYFCKYQPIYIYMPAAVGVLASSLLAIHRLIATVWPQTFAAVSNSRVITALIVLPWIVAGSTTIFPTVLNIGPEFVPSNNMGGCEFARAPESAFDMVSAVLDFIVPTIVMGMCYGIVLVKTYRAVRINRGNRTRQRRFEISRTLFLSFLWHTVCIYPTLVVVTCFPETLVKNPYFYLAVSWLPNSFSFVNPIFFLASSRMFQDGIKEFLQCHWYRAAPVHPALDEAGDEMSMVGVGCSWKQIRRRSCPTP